MRLPPGSATCRMACRIGDTTARSPVAWKSRSARRSRGCGRAPRPRVESVIDLKLLRPDPQAVAKNLARRGYQLDVAGLQGLEDKRKPWQVELDRLRGERNANARAVAIAKGRGEDTAALIANGESLN